MWGKMHGQRCSSTRMEIAGLINSMTRAIPLHIGIDSASTIAKATKLQEEAKRRCQSDMVNWWLRRNPYRRPWGLQADGDLWRLYWQGLMERGPQSILICKVKAHATDQHVKDNLVKIEDKQGNDWADTYAGRGIQEHGDAALTIARYFSQRQGGYQKMMAAVQQIIIEVTKAEKAEREEKEDHEHGGGL